MPLVGGGSSLHWAKFAIPEVREGVFNIFIQIPNPIAWDEFSNLGFLFNAYYPKMFRDCVLETHRYLIRTTPIDTGRLRGGWTAYLDKYQADYAMAFMDTSLIETKSSILSSAAIQEGKALSQVAESGQDVTLTNNVDYGGYVEFGTSRMQGRHFTVRAMYKGEHVIANAFDKWFKECNSAGALVEPKKVEEVV